MSITQNIRKIRAAKGISQETMAEWLQVSRQTISKWENGQAQPSADNLFRLSQVLDVPIDALVKDDWTPPEEETSEIQVAEAPVEVPIHRSRNYRLWILLAAIVLAVGVLAGTLLFQKQDKKLVYSSELEGEVIDNLVIEESAPLLPMN